MFRSVRSSACQSPGRIATRKTGEGRLFPGVPLLRNIRLTEGRTGDTGRKGAMTLFYFNDLGAARHTLKPKRRDQRPQGKVSQPSLVAAMKAFGNTWQSGHGRMLVERRAPTLTSPRPMWALLKRTAPLPSRRSTSPPLLWRGSRRY